MKIKNLKSSMFFAVALLILSLPSTVRGNEGHHAEGSEGHEHNSTIDVDETTMLSPIWHKILKTQKALNGIVESGDLETVHEAAFKIRDLSKELLKRTTDEDLNEEQMDNVKATVERMSEVAEALDEYGDGGDQINTEKQLKKMNRLIDFIDMQYAEDDEDGHHEEEESE